MKIGIDPKFNTDRLTGVGNYTYCLLKALVHGFSDVEFSAFIGMSWIDADPEYFACVAQTFGKSPGSIISKSRNSISRDLRTTLSQNRWAKACHERIVTGSRRWQFKRTAAHQKLDVFHAFNFLPLTEIDLPTIPVVYDLSFVRHPSAHPPDRLRRLEPLSGILERAPAIHTISAFSKNEICEIYDVEPARVFIAPPAASSIFRALGEDITRSDTQLYDLDLESYFLAVGTLEPRKNLKTIIDAYSRLTPSLRVRHPLVIVGGSGWGDIDLPKASSALRREGSLRFLGVVSDSQLRSLYEGARALLFPSVYEGFGMPVVEAFSCGCQVVHGVKTAMSEISANLAIQIDPKESDDWLRVMNDLIEQPQHERIKARVLRMNRADHFSWTESARVVHDIYGSLKANR